MVQKKNKQSAAERVNTVKELAKQGFWLSEIARRMNLATDSIRTIATKYNIDVPKYNDVCAAGLALPHPVTVTAMKTTDLPVDIIVDIVVKCVERLYRGSDTKAAIDVHTESVMNERQRNINARLPEQMTDAIVDDYLDGVYIRDLVKKYQVSKEMVYRSLRRRNLGSERIVRARANAGDVHVIVKN